jgi:chitinase
MVKYFTYNGVQWVGYDDSDTIALKKSMANSYCLGGTMIWSVDFGVSEGQVTILLI